MTSYWEEQRLNDATVALALSGGPDSMALYRALVILKKKLIVLHVDHRLRPTSADEAAKLQEITRQDGVPFFLHTLAKIDKNAPNLEDQLRNARYAFFSQTLEAENIHHLFLGHQQADVEETVLKRILEGASLFKIPALIAPKQRGSVTLHRPLTSFKKEQLMAFLKELKSGFFIDETNSDLKFLRARMREVIFPFLNQSFEKRIDGKFYQLAKELQLVIDYLKQVCQPHLNQLEERHDGLFFPQLSIPLVELQYIFSHIFDRLHESPTKDQVQTLIRLYLAKAPDKQVILKNYRAVCRKKGVTFIKKISS